MEAVGSQQDRKDFGRFAAGDLEGFESLVLRYKDSLIYFLNRYVKNLDTAEELAQDVFVDVFLYPERFRQDKNFKTWIFSIGHHKAVDLIRREGRIVYEESQENIRWQASVETQYMKKEQMSCFFQAFHSLKPQYQSALYLTAMEDFSYKEAAEALEKTEGAFKLLLYRARRALQKEMEKEGWSYEIR